MVDEHSRDASKPCPEAPAGLSRRSLLFRFGVGLNAVAGLALSIPIVGYVFAAFRRRGWQEWIELGGLDEFPVKETRLASYANPFSVPWDGKSAEDIPCWVRRLDETRFKVFAINCTHLGCPVRWFEQSELFMCPCHGGAYYADGARASGPPPRGLFEYEYKVEEGRLLLKAGSLPTLHRPA